VPGFLGHESGVSAVHVKRGVVSFLVGLAYFVFAWFQSGPKQQAAALTHLPPREGRQQRRVPGTGPVAVKASHSRLSRLAGDGGFGLVDLRRPTGIL
jgi:hypothetical protein